MNAHLALMSKPRLIAIITETQRRAQQNADLADYWRGVTNGLIDTAPKPSYVPSPETTWAEARRILRGLPTDPLAEEHRDELRAAINYGGKGPAFTPGPRCHRPRCGKRLNADDLCSRHDFRTIRANKETS